MFEGGRVDILGVSGWLALTHDPKGAPPSPNSGRGVSSLWQIGCRFGCPVIL